jgi:DNA polymerase V
MLEKSGICNALQLRDADDRWVRKQMTVVGLKTIHELRGIQCIPFEATPKTRQQLCCSRTFGASTDDLGELRAAVSWFTAHAAQKLREHKLLAGSLTVFLVTDRFKQGEPQYEGSFRLSVAPKSDSTLELLPLALNGLHRAFCAGFQIRKAGVILDDFELADCSTRRLWDSATQDIHKRLMGAVDSLNYRFGGDTVQCGLFPSAGVWRTRSERQPPNYTTDWRDVMIAR